MLAESAGERFTRFTLPSVRAWRALRALALRASAASASAAAASAATAALPLPGLPLPLPFVLLWLAAAPDFDVNRQGIVAKNRVGAASCPSRSGRVM